MSDGVQEVGADSAVAESSAEAVSITLWTRRPVCGPRTTVIDRLSAFDTAGRIGEFAVETWPEEIVVDDGTGHADLLDRIDRFEQWATDNGLTLRPPFETRTKSLLVGTSETVLKTPIISAAVYEGDELVGFYPCTDGEYTWTVMEYLDAFDREGDLPHESGDRPVPSSDA